MKQNDSTEVLEWKEVKIQSHIRGELDAIQAQGRSGRQYTIFLHNNSPIIQYPVGNIVHVRALRGSVRNRTLEEVKQMCETSNRREFV